MQLHHDQNSFHHVEYHEAANAYFKGVDIGYTTLRNYVTLNALFGAVVAALMDPNFGSSANASGAIEILSIVPWVAIAASLLLGLALPHYFNHLENCRHRCQELEQLLGGHLFTRLGGVANNKRSFNAAYGLIGVIVLMSALWTYVGLRLTYGSFSLFEVGRNLLS